MRLSQTPEFKAQKAKVDAAKTWKGKLTAAGAFALTPGRDIDKLGPRTSPKFQADERNGTLTYMVLDDMLPESDHQAEYVFTIMEGLRGLRPRTLDLFDYNPSGPTMTGFLAALKALEDVDAKAAKAVRDRIEGQGESVEAAQAEDAKERAAATVKQAAAEITKPIRQTWGMLPWILAGGFFLYAYAYGGKRK